MSLWRSLALSLLFVAACASASGAPEREARFLAKWGPDGRGVVEAVPSPAALLGGARDAGDGGGNPFALLIQAIQQITSTWQSIVNAFKSSYSEQIADKEFGNGWSKFKSGTKVFKGAGLTYDHAPEFFADVQHLIQIPANYSADFNQQIKWIQFFDNLTWSEHNTQFAKGKGGTDTDFTMYARNRQDEQKIDVLFLTEAESFKLADNYFVISQSRSILGGLFSSTKLKFKNIPAGITDQQLTFVSEYFTLLAYQEIALAEGMSVPPDPQFPTSV